MRWTRGPNDSRVAARARSLSAAAVAVALMLTPVVPAATIDASAFSTLSDALAALSPGDTLTIPAGSYNEPITISTPGVTVRGAGLVVLHAGGNHNIRVEADNVTLEDLELRDAFHGVLSAGNDGLVLRNVTAWNQGGAAIRIDGDSNVLLESVFTRGAGVNAVAATDLRGLRVHASDVQSLGRSIHVLRSSDVEITDTFARSATENALVIEDSGPGVRVAGSTLFDSSISLWIIRTPGIVVEDTLTAHYTATGVRIEDSPGATVTGGRSDGLFNPLTRGVHVVRSDDVLLDGTEIHGHTLNGVEVRDSEGVVLRGLDVHDNFRGVHVRDGGSASVAGGFVHRIVESAVVIEDVDGPNSVSGTRIDGANLGLWVIRSGPIEISDVMVDNVTDRGIVVEGTPGVLVSDARVGLSTEVAMNTGIDVHGADDAAILGGEVTAARVNGIHLADGSGYEVSGTWVHDTQRGLHALRLEDSRIHNLTMANFDDNAIVVEPGIGVEVDHNELRNGSIGIWFRGGPGMRDNVIHHNQVTGFRSSGISLDHDAKNHTVHDNAVTASKRGYKLVAGGGATPDMVVSGNVFRNNSAVGNLFGVWTDETRGENEWFGGTVHSSAVCDFVARNDTSLRVSGTDVGAGATAENVSSFSFQGLTGLVSECRSGPVVFAKALEDHECSQEEWHFVITDLRHGMQPPSSIHVLFSDGAQVTVPLDRVTGKTAHYSTDLHLDATVLAASAVAPDDWAGQFNLSHGPC